MKHSRQVANMSDLINMNKVNAHIFLLKANGDVSDCLTAFVKIILGIQTHIMTQT